MTGIRVLLADDHALVRRSLCRLIDGWDHVSVAGEAGTTDQAFEIVEAADVDVALVDLEIPKDGGVALGRRLRTARPHVARLAVSAHDAPADVAAAFASGFHGFVSKHSAADELREAIHAVVGGERYLAASAPPPRGHETPPGTAVRP